MGNLPVLWGLLTCLLLKGEIKFSFTIPTPLANLCATLKLKKELNNAIADKYTKMATLEGGKFVAAHEEVKVLEAKLEKL